MRRAMRRRDCSRTSLAGLALTVAALGAAMLAGACEAPTAALPDGAIAFAPLPPYATWWQLLESCSGLTGSFAAVQWYVADAVDPSDDLVNGEWLSAGNRIVVTPRSARDGGVVRHEMLHALVRGGGHPAEYFADRCGSLVYCQVGCAVPEHDRGVPSSAPFLPQASLDVSVRFAPAAPSVSIDSGWVRIIVDVTNPSGEDVWVDVRSNGAFGWATVNVPGIYGDILAAPGPAWAFRANERRSYTFDAQFAAGTYEMHGLFSLHGTDAYWLTVGP
jgi:hypothetical protein